MNNSNLMRLAHVLATDSSFRSACEIDLKSALARKCIALTGDEFTAFRRLQTLICRWIDGDGAFPMGWPPGLYWG
ncbi:MAG TPA: hypothetical protein ENN19_07030 [Chloroflexi bacterium]|nr:hypothetical protein [Chloroflexota bacterium]